MRWCVSGKNLKKRDGVIDVAHGSTTQDFGDTGVQFERRSIVDGLDVFGAVRPPDRAVYETFETRHRILRSISPAAGREWPHNDM
jgi:hypothetical protein